MQAKILGGSRTPLKRRRSSCVTEFTVARGDSVPQIGVKRVASVYIQPQPRTLADLQNRTNAVCGVLSQA